MQKPEHLLICDDSEDTLLITRFALEAEGFVVETAKSTDELFQQLRKEDKPFLIILDLNIPAKGGAFVIQQLRSEEQSKKIPVVLFSGEEKLEEITVQLKADGFLHKPFNIDELKEIVRKFS